MSVTNICLHVDDSSPVTPGGWAQTPHRHSGRSLVPRITDQRFARPEQQHQHNPEHTHHSKNRLIQHNPGNMGPEPGRDALHPEPEGLLAGLMEIVPEFAKPGKPQGLVGDPAGPVIDHENEPARQQQQPYKSEKAADHAPPSYLL